MRLSDCTVLSALLACGCASTSTNNYEAQLVRTSYGVPHVRANDLGGLGFGQGYAAAQDQLCTIADQIVRIRSERAKFFGPGDGGANVDDDLALAALDVRATARAGLMAMPSDARELLSGYVAGYNAFLADTPRERRPAPCRDAAWVTPIDEVDVVARGIDLALVGFERVLLPAIARAAPPGRGVARVEPPLEPMRFGAASNGWALGRESTASGRGMLLANPHFPLDGELRFHEVHLTLPSKVDVYGVSLLGMPGVAIGFNERVAWTATASASSRSTVYRLKLTAGDPTSYEIDGRRVAMERREIAVDVLRGGRVVRETRTLYRSQHGPIVALPGVGWTNDTATAIKSAGADDVAIVSTWFRMMTAGSVGELRDALRGRGMPWANVLAADRAGNALYVDASRVPALPAAAERDWIARVASDPMTAKLAARKLVLLDGSTSQTLWRDLVPIDDAPTLARLDFVFNANDAGWMSNPSAPLARISPLFGPIEKALSPRTRMNARLLAGRGERRFSLADLEGVVTANEGLVTDLVKPEIVARCREATNAAPRVREACEVLARWDGRDTLDSPGAVLFREVLGALEARGGIFRDGFDRAAPIDTPRVPALAPTAAGDPVADALTTAIARLDAAGLPLDAPLSRAQFLARAGARVPIAGCSDLEGCLNVVGFTDRLTTSRMPLYRRAPEIDEATGLGRDGYPVNYGSSYVLVVELGDGAPRADAILVHGESGDAASAHYDDQARLWAEGRLRPVRFTPSAVDGDARSREWVSTPRRRRP